MEQKEILVKSTIDGTMQPSLFYKSASKEKRPLLVGLHTWSFDRFNQIANMLPVAEKYDFNLLLPEFRHVLPGTTALRAAALAKAFMPVVLTDITEEILEDAAEILVLGTTCECVAVTHYNGKPVGDGRPGPIADRLRHLLHDALVTGGVPFLE